MGKDVGFWVQAPEGGLVASFSAFDPELGCDEGGDLEVFLFADSQAAIKQRARTLGIPYPGLKRDNDSTWITVEDVQAAVSSEDGAVWRRGRDVDPPGQYRNIREWPGTYEQPRP